MCTYVVVVVAGVVCTWLRGMWVGVRARVPLTMVSSSVVAKCYKTEERRVPDGFGWFYFFVIVVGVCVCVCVCTRVRA